MSGFGRIFDQLCGVERPVHPASLLARCERFVKQAQDRGLIVRSIRLRPDAWRELWRQAVGRDPDPGAVMTVRGVPIDEAPIHVGNIHGYRVLMR